MAIEPAGIIKALQTINQDTPIESFMNQLYMQLPTCINRAIATLQCAQLEKEYKPLVEKMKVEFDFDLHLSIRNQIEKILTRKR